MISILLVDDHPMILEGTKNLFSEETDLLVETEQDASKVLERIKQQPFDMYIIDINMPIMNGLLLTDHIKSVQPSALVILYTGDDITDYYSYVWEGKAIGLLSKTASKEQTIQLIRSVIRGEIVLPADFIEYMRNQQSGLKTRLDLQLNRKETQLLQWLGEGLMNKEIAKEMNVSERTIERYLSGIYEVLQVRTRREAVEKAKEMNLV